MSYYKLIRESREGKAVRGHIYQVEHRFSRSKGVQNEYLTMIAPTMENADCLIPALIYKVQVNISPKFGTLMPLLLQVPGRTGIRIHGGTKPEHSQGCVLITRKKEYQSFVRTLLDEQNSAAPIYLELCDHTREN